MKGMNKRNGMIYKTSCCLIVLFFFITKTNAQKQPYDYVNTFIGTQDGNTYPGAQAPFGMLSVSPSNTFADYNDAYARPGYQYPEKVIRGISLTHFSGVGCHAMQDIMFMLATAIDSSPVYKKNAYTSAFSHQDEKASPGYYSMKLNGYDIDVQFAAALHSCIGEINYNKNQQKYLVFEPTNSANGISNGEINIDTINNKVTGFITTGGFCWRDPADRPYVLYFLMEFDKKIDAFGVWKGNYKMADTSKVSGNNIAAYLSFAEGDTKVKMKTAISSVSVANAQLNLSSEIKDWNLISIKEKAKKDWSVYLNKIQVSGGTEDEKTTFYTAVYHNLLQPNIWQDVNGEYKGFDDKIHAIEKGRSKYVNFSLWDTYRTTAYLQAMLAPKEASDMVHSLLLDAEQGGAFPNWSMNNKEYGVMNGYSPLPFIANMYAVGARNFNLNTVKNMMKKVSITYHGCQGIAGWANLEDYKKYGYVPVDKHGFGTSMTEEYGIDDYAVAKMCEAAGDTAANYYFKRSQNVFNLYNSATGFIQAKTSDGQFVKNFRDTSQIGFNEGNAIQYLWSVPHSITKLIQVAGGNKKMDARLDTFISVIEEGWAPGKPHYWIGNEPCFGAVYVYNYLQTPWKAQYNVRRIISRYFTNSPEGLPGDDDVGAMSALYVFSAIGWYPYLPATGGFTVTGPLFNQIKIKLDTGKIIEIQGKNAQTDAPYIQGMKLNGKPSSSLWINWNTISNGAVVSFEMGRKENKNWGAGKKDMPPSFEAKLLSD